MDRSVWFNHMWDKAPHVKHIYSSVWHACRILTVIENSENVDTDSFPANGEGVIRCAVVDDAHRRDWNITFNSEATRRAMKFSYADASTPYMQNCSVGVFKYTDLKAVDYVFECVMDIQVSDPKAPQEVFLTTPVIESVPSQTRGKVQGRGGRMVNIVSILRSSASATVHSSSPTSDKTKGDEKTADSSPPNYGADKSQGRVRDDKHSVIEKGGSPEEGVERINYGQADNAVRANMEEFRIKTGEDRQQLHLALMTHCPTRPELERLVSFRLNVNLNQVTGAGDLSTAVFDLIQWAEAQGRLTEILAAIPPSILRLPPQHLG
ncbi:MAG TPA: effector-associated domain EAD1-containing protein [Pyrinomonadaceae bacterium]|nr:effector-associated domain EAD1-containing protein [Pyrinomonadaceae bacterium]